jgi:hypothetical protein
MTRRINILKRNTGTEAGLKIPTARVEISKRWTGEILEARYNN